MRRPLWAAYVAILVALGSARSASADIIEADFTGTARGGYLPSPNSSVVLFNHVPFTAQFFFDTASSTIVEISPGTFRLTENFFGPPFASGSIGLSGIGGISMVGSGILVWDGSGPISASINGNHGSISASLTFEGGFQLGLCPDINDTPCGVTDATSAFFVGPAPAVVPGPTVGAGASSFAFAVLFLGWLAYRRRTQTAFTPA